ncbi:MAG TPA: adenylate/guanylate cyclase domain-containing protein, partial [Chthoniobacteraceae bacterium]
EIFVPDYWRQNFRSGAVFKDTLVVIGAAGNWQHDEHRTSLGLMPGPELQLNALNAFLSNDLLHPLSRPRSFVFTVLAGALAVALGRACSSPFIRLLLIGLATAAWAGLALLFFNAGALIPVVPPLLALGLNGLIGVGHDVSRERLERRRLRRTLERYVSKNVVHEVLDHPQEYMANLGGAVRPVTVLFSDIRDYSVLSVTSDPHALVAQLNEYLTAMVDCVFRHGGTLDKFIGDAVMAVWGNAQTLGPREDTLSATRAAFAMREELEKLNARWRATGRPELAVGIAVNHGDVIVGNIGSPQRMEYTVIGDAVNLTWRLQELTKRLPFALLVGKTAASFISEHFDVQALGSHEVSGQPEPVEVFGVAGEVALGKRTEESRQPGTLTAR